MKTKYLFYSLALASAFAACSQEELIEAPVAENNLANRPVAGVVEFSTEGVESRFNHESAEWEDGDVFGLYLMDEYKGNFTGAPNGADCPGEHKNANQYLAKKLDGVADEVNGYSLWAYQDHWFGMYQFVNNIQSNYPFTYSSSDETWTNDAKLVEGNYFAMYPQNEKALNRRELWHEIDPSITLKKHSDYNNGKDKYFLNLDNQFFLGYSQIYRNETSSAEGALKMDLSLKGALVPVHLRIRGWSDTRVKLDKIEFKSASGAAMPTLAYIEPAQESTNNMITSNWVTVTPKATAPYYNWYEKTDCNTTIHGKGLYNEDLTWTRKTIQSLVRWAAPGEEGRMPYGCDSNVAYEYSFAFPGEFAEKVILEDEKTDVVNVYFALPAFMGQDENRETVEESVYAAIYGWQWIAEDNNGNGRWQYGILTNTKLGNDASSVNKSFNLDGTMLSSWINAEEGKYFLLIETDYDNYGWVPVSQALVSSTEEMNNSIKGAVTSHNSGETVQVTVQPDAEGVEVEEELVEWLTEQSKYYKQIEITFDGSRDGKVYFNDNNTMFVNTKPMESNHNVIFKYEGGVELINNAVQDVKNYTMAMTATITNNGTINVLENAEISANTTVVNNGTMIVGGTELTSKVLADVTNYNTLTMKKNSTMGAISNKGGKANVEGNTTVASFTNENGTVDCNTCVAELNVNAGKMLVNDKFENKAAALVTVAENAVLDMDSQVKGYVGVNEGSILNEGSIVLSAYFKNMSGAVMNNEGSLTIDKNGESTFDNMKGGIVNNEGNITIAKFNNKGVVNENGGSIISLTNLVTDEAKFDKGILNVYSTDSEVQTTAESKGYIIFKDVVAQEVGLNGKGTDTRIFETSGDETLYALAAKMYKTASTIIRTSHNITFDNPATIGGVSANDLTKYLGYTLKYIYVDGTNVVLQNADDCTIAWTFAEAALVVKQPESGVTYGVTVLNGTEINFKRVDKSSKPYIHVGSNSKVAGTNGVTIQHTSNN